MKYTYIEAVDLIKDIKCLKYNHTIEDAGSEYRLTNTKYFLHIYNDHMMRRGYNRIQWCYDVSHGGYSLSNFRKVFEGASEDIKAELIYHLDLFNKD